MDEMKENISMEKHLWASDGITMKEVLGKPLNEAEQERRKAEYDRLANEKVMFRGVERRRGDFCSFADEELGHDAQLSYLGFTEEETQKVSELAKPFNVMFRDGTENSMSMFAGWMDADGFIFRVDDDSTGSTIKTVRELDLEKFLANWLRP